jgi:hypothetical protein
MSLSVMPGLIRHPEVLKKLDSGFRRNDILFGNHQFIGELYGMMNKGSK